MNTKPKVYLHTIILSWFSSIQISSITMNPHIIHHNPIHISTITTNPYIIHHNPFIYYLAQPINISFIITHSLMITYCKCNVYQVYGLWFTLIQLAQSIHVSYITINSYIIHHNPFMLVSHASMDLDDHYCNVICIGFKVHVGKINTCNLCILHHNPFIVASNTSIDLDDH